VHRLGGAALTAADLSLLDVIARGDAPRRSSSGHVLRLELMGLVRDGAGGVAITEDGKRALHSRWPSFVREPAARPAEKFDALGRRHGRNKSRGSILF
jgi:hypothetical protein